MPTRLAFLLLTFLFSCDFDPGEQDEGRLDYIAYNPKAASIPDVRGYPPAVSYTHLDVYKRQQYPS